MGANSYWLPLLTSPDDVEVTFQSMKSAGIKVLRTWVDQDQPSYESRSHSTYTGI